MGESMGLETLLWLACHNYLAICLAKFLWENLKDHYDFFVLLIEYVCLLL